MLCFLPTDFPYFETTGFTSHLRVYRNVGCFLCNKRNDPQWTATCRSDQLMRTIIPNSLRAILDFDSPHRNEIQETVGNCNEMQIYDSFMVKQSLL